MWLGFDNVIIIGFAIWHSIFIRIHVPDSKVHGTNMGPTWVLSAPDGPHVGPMNLALRGTKKVIKIINMAAIISVTDDKLYYPRFNTRIHKFSRVYATPANNQQHWYIIYKFNKLNRYITSEITQYELQHAILLFSTYLLMSSIISKCPIVRCFQTWSRKISHIIQLYHCPGVSDRETVFL